MQSADTLVRMANQISKFFHVQGEERAVDGVADHMRRFWEPRMKTAIFAHLDAGGEGLDPTVKAAVAKLKEAYNGKLNGNEPAKAQAKPSKSAKSSSRGK